MEVESVPSLPCMISVLDGLQAAALMIHREGTVVHANPRLCAMLGRSLDQLVGRAWAEFYEHNDRERVRANIAAWVPAEAESFLPHADGRQTPVIYSARPLANHPQFAIVTIVDLSPRNDFEKRLRTQYEEVARLSDTVIEQALDLKGHSEQLEQKVAERTRELYEAQLDAVYMLAVASEARDDDTGAHVRRVERMTTAIAAALGLKQIRAEELGRAAILHDVGKIHLPDQILKKPGKLTPEEYREMQTHTVAGERILSDKPFFAETRRIARSHHENWDGSGYPDGLRGDEIPFAARIVRVVDVFDALTSKRVYKPAWPRDDALRFIDENAGTMFDADVVRALRALEK